MTLAEEIKAVFNPFPATCSEKKGLVTVEVVVAERKAFLSRKKLVYVARYRIDEGQRELRFTEMLKESGFGLAGGQEFDGSPGFGFKKETYRTGGGGRQGTIEAQSSLFGKRYNYTFDWQSIRGAVEARARDAGFAFNYQITSAGI